MNHIGYDPRAKGPRVLSVSSSYNYDERHFRFQRSLVGDLESNKRFSGWGYDLLALAGIAVCVAVLWVGAWVLL